MTTKNPAFARMPLPVIVSPALSSLGFRVLALIAAKAYYRPASLRHTEIASALNCSERQALRETARLVASKFITARKRPNAPNLYALNPEVFSVKAAAASFGPVCLKCGTPTRKLGASGWCPNCVKLVNSDRKPASKAIA